MVCLQSTHWHYQNIHILWQKYVYNNSFISWIAKVIINNTRLVQDFAYVENCSFHQADWLPGKKHRHKNNEEGDSFITRVISQRTLLSLRSLIRCARHLNAFREETTAFHSMIDNIVQGEFKQIPLWLPCQFLHWSQKTLNCYSVQPEISESEFSKDRQFVIYSFTKKINNYFYHFPSFFWYFSSVL